MRSFVTIVALLATAQAQVNNVNNSGSTNTATSNNSITNTGNNIVINGGGSGTSVSVTGGTQSITSNTSATSTSNGGNNVNTATSNNVISNTGNSVVINNNNSGSTNTSTSNNVINNSGNTVTINNGGVTTTSNNLLGSEPLNIKFFPTDGTTNPDFSVTWFDHQCTDNDFPVNFSVCCEAGVSSEEASDTVSPCPIYSYDTDSEVCSVVSPTNPSMPAEFVYVPTKESCCRNFGEQGDRDLLEACFDIPDFDVVEEAVCIKEVYETTSDTCETVTGQRQKIVDAAGALVSLAYDVTDTASTPLRCCLASADFSENVNACSQDTEQYDEFEYDPEAPVGEQCSRVTYEVTNADAPGLISRVVQVVLGEPEEVNREFVDNAVCCEELGGEACAGEEPGEDNYIDGQCIDGADGTPCQTCDLTFQRTTDFFSDPLASIGSFVNSIIDPEVMMVSGAPQDRCCEAGVQMGRDDLIQACLEDDGDEEIMLELTDQGECIQREIQPQRYAQADGSAVPGYGPIDRVLDAEMVSADICCEAGCAGDESQPLLAACAAREEEAVGTDFAITGDFGPLSLGLLFAPQCERQQISDITYTKSDGSLACKIQNTVTYSTEFGDDDQVVMGNCCSDAAAKNGEVPAAISDDQLETFCEKKEIVTEGSDVEWDDGFLFGIGRCLMEDGTLQTVYCDLEGVIQKEETPRDMAGQSIDKKLCCTAYDESSPLNNDFELTFACEEIEVDEEIVAVDPTTTPPTCKVDEESYVFVDRDADEEFDASVDEQYDYQLVEGTDASGDRCCEKAGEEGDIETAKIICDKCEVEEDDEFYTYDAPICTRRFDRTTSCFTSGVPLGDLIGNPLLDPTIVDFENCIEETVPVSECCEAKQLGKKGSGLDAACANINFVPQLQGMGNDGLLGFGLTDNDTLINLDILNIS